MMRMLITKPKDVTGEGTEWLDDLQRDIKRVKWVDDFTKKLAFRSVRFDDSSAPQEIGKIEKHACCCCLCLLSTTSMSFSLLFIYFCTYKRHIICSFFNLFFIDLCFLTYLY